MWHTRPNYATGNDAERIAARLLANTAGAGGRRTIRPNGDGLAVSPSARPAEAGVRINIHISISMLVGLDLTAGLIEQSGRAPCGGNFRSAKPGAAQVGVDVQYRPSPGKNLCVLRALIGWMAWRWVRSRALWLVTADPGARVCPGCGTTSGHVRERVVTRPDDVGNGRGQIGMVWVKRRWECRVAR